ncbi:MAG: hypothetical protein KGL39_23155 [Patescibacteria group bacterium]|nr:hypothetical protein [Patescibacteria group bacterium]
MNILQEADAITSGARRGEYGGAAESFGKIARLWSVVLGVEVTPMQAVLCMIQLKVARQTNGHKRDSLVDIAGYARIGEMLVEEQAKQTIIDDEASYTLPRDIAALKPSGDDREWLDWAKNILDIAWGPANARGRK